MHRTQRQELKEWGTQIRIEVQDVLHDPLNHFADRVDAFIADQPEVVNELAQLRQTDEVRYSVHDLPPNLYQHCGGIPFIPQTDRELSVFLDSFWSGNLQLHANTIGVHAHATFPEHRDHLELTLRHRREQGLEVDVADWQAYQRSYTSQLERGFFSLGHNAAVMNIPRILGLAAARQTPDFARGRQRSYQISSMDSPHSPGLYLRVPESGYGEAHTDRLLRAGGFVYDLMHRDPRLRADLWDVYDKNPYIVNTHTERAVLNSHLYGPAESLVVTSQEGIGSILGSIALGMPQVMPEYADAEQVMERIVENRIPDKLALISPLGIVGAASTFGIYFPGALRGDTSGKLVFDEQMLDDMAEIHTRATAIMHERWAEYMKQVAEAKPGEPLPMPPTRTGLSCPAAGAYVRTVPEKRREISVIDRLSRTVLNAYKVIGHDPNATRLNSPWLPNDRFAAYNAA